MNTVFYFFKTSQNSSPYCNPGPYCNPVDTHWSLDDDNCCLHTLWWLPINESGRNSLEYKGDISGRNPNTRGV